jgi:hypothetical protein
MGFVPTVSGKVPAGELFVTTVTIAVIKHKCSLLKNLGFFTVVFSPGPLQNTVDAETARRRTVFYHREGKYRTATERNTGSKVSLRSAVPSELRYRASSPRVV